MSHFVLELEVIYIQQPLFKMSLPVILDEDSYEQKRNFRRALDKCKDGYVNWRELQEKHIGKLGEFSLVEEFLNHVESLIEENIDSPNGITYGTIMGQNLFYQVSVREM